MTPPVTFDPLEAQEVVRALAAIAAADGAVVLREDQVFEGFAIRYNLGSHAWVAAPLDEAGLVALGLDAAKQAEVLRLCLRVAYADGAYSPAEAALIARVARALGCGDAALESLRAEAERERAASP